MEISQLPTDNLYKFMAIAGVVLLLFGLSYPLRLATELQRQIVEVQVQVDIAELRTEQIQSRVEELKKADDLTREQVQAVEADLYDLQEQAAKDRGAAAKSRLLLYHFLLFAIIGLACIVSGSILARIGFKLWYERVQKPSDQKTLSSGT